MPNPIYATRLQAKIVTLDNSYTQALGQVVIDVKNSVEAGIAAKALDVGTNTHSAVLEFYVTRDTGVVGDIGRYQASYFKIQIEPYLVIREATLGDAT